MIKKNSADRRSLLDYNVMANDLRLMKETIPMDDFISINLDISAYILEFRKKYQKQ